MFVGPGMKTGFWLDMGASSILVDPRVPAGTRVGNFFEIVFHKRKFGSKALEMHGE
jgi:hypothetical protein